MGSYLLIKTANFKDNKVSTVTVTDVKGEYKYYEPKEVYTPSSIGDNNYSASADNLYGFGLNYINTTSQINAVKLVPYSNGPIRIEIIRDNAVIDSASGEIENSEDSTKAIIVQLSKTLIAQSGDYIVFRSGQPGEYARFKFRRNFKNNYPFTVFSSVSNKNLYDSTLYLNVAYVFRY